MAVCAASIFAASASAQEEVKQLGTTDLKDQALGLVNSKKYIEARPYMNELITRLSDTDDDKIRKQLEDLYFFMAYSYVQEYEATKDDKLLDKAISYFDKVIKEFPGGKMANSSIEVVASCYAMRGDMVKAATCRERLLQPPYSNTLNKSQRYAIVKKIADSLFAARQWKEGEKWFTQKLDGATDPEDKVSAASALIQAATNLKKFNDISKYLKYMSIDTVSRSDLGLNMALLDAGDKLVAEKRYSEASALYSMVYGRDRILKNLNAYLQSAKKRVAVLQRINPTNPLIAEINAKVAMVEQAVAGIEGIGDYTADLMLRSSRNYMLTKRDYESFWSFMQLLDPKFKDHQAREDFFYSAIIGAYRIGRMEEMYNLCQQYLKEYSDGQYVNDAQLRIAQYWLGKKNYPEFFKIAKAFVEEYPDESPYSNDLVFLMGSTWLTNEKYDDLIETFSKYSEDFEDSGISDGLLYWLGMGYMGKGDFKNAGKTFGEIAENYSISPYAEDAGYRQGVALYGIGDYPAAQKALESFVESYPKSKVRGEVEFFLGDIFANSMLVKESLEHYMNVEKYTKSQPIIDNAYTQAAKLLTSDEKYDETVKLMDSYLAKFKEGSRSEINYLKGRALEKLGLPADALNVYRKAIEEYGGNPHDDGVDKMILDYNRLYNENFDMLNATIAFIEKLMGDRELLYNMVEVPAQRYRYFMANPKIDKRIYTSFKRDASFGPNLYNDKSNIKALLEKYKKQLQEYPQNAENYFKSLAKAAADKKNITLEYRLMMGLDAIGKPVQVERMFNENDIKKSSVRTLAWIGKLNEKLGGADQARKAFDEALNREEYEYLIDVLFAAAELETRQTNWDKVLADYTRIEDDFPGNPRAANAALKKADTYMALGRHKEAEAKYETIMRSTSWRGDAYAEALYKLGQIAEEQKDTNKALMYYERCYLGYAGSLDWTGKAVIAAAKLMASNGKRDEGRALCKEFVVNPSNAKSPQFDEVKQLELTI